MSKQCYYCKLSILHNESYKPILFRDGSGKVPDIDATFHADSYNCFARLKTAHEELKAKINIAEVDIAINCIEQEISGSELPRFELEQVLRVLKALK